MDSYITASAGTVRSYRQLIAKIMVEGSKTVSRSKRIKIIDCIPIANKKVSSEEDVEKVIITIKKKLLTELKENDELNLD